MANNYTKSDQLRYRKEDVSKRKKQYNDLVLRGCKIEGNVMSDYILITEYMQRHTGLNLEDLHLLCYLAGLDSTVDWQNILDCPNGLGEVRSKKKIYTFVDLGLLKKFDKVYTSIDMCIQYRLTTKARNIVRLYNNLMLGVEKISMNPIHSDSEFVSKRKKKYGKHVINWYRAIIKFNKKVEEN